MIEYRRWFAGAFAFLAAAAAGVAATNDAPRTPAAAAIGFAGIEVHAFKPGTACLRLADLNGDGRQDIVFINAREARLEVLLRRKHPPAPDTEMPKTEQVFDVCGTVVNQDLEIVHLVDLDGDARPDVLAFGRPLGLQRFRIDAQGKPRAPEEIFLDSITDVRTVDAGDLDGDGRPDIAVFREKAVDLLWNDGSSALPRRLRLPLSEERTVLGGLADVDGDGALDMVFLMKPPGAPIVLRLGDGKGAFGPEIPIECSRGETMELLKTAGQSEPRIASVIGGGSSLRLTRFCHALAAPFFDTASATPVRLCLRGADKDVPPSLTADTNGDGYDDLLVAAPELSAIHLYLGNSNGLAAAPTTIDSLAGISSMARLSNGALIVVSRPEKAAGLHAAGRLSAFPELIKLPGDALTCAALGQKGYVVCHKGDKYQLVSIEPGGKTGAPLNLPGVLNDPRRALAMPLGNGAFGLLLFAEFAEPRMFRVSGKTATPIEAAAFQPLGQTLKPERVGLVVEGGTNMIVVCANRTARGYTWNGSRFEVLRQFNPEDKQADLIGACSFGPMAGQTGLLALDRAGRSLLWFGAGNTPRRLQLQADLGDVEGVAPLNTPHGPRLALVGKNAIHLLAPGAATIRAEVCADYQSASKDPHLTRIFAIQLQRGRPIFAAVDGANNTLELLEQSDGALANRLTFKVFEAPNLISARALPFLHEPHNIEAGDLNGDGLADIAMLCHDRLLIYFGE